VIIEAQACGVPVIGSDSGAIPEVIGKAGMIFKEGDINDLTRKLMTLARSASLRKKLGISGQKQVLKKYTNQKIAEQIYEIYLKFKTLSLSEHKTNNKSRSDEK
jgi:glycosyltransferase involved in cell wall biosynthesis